MKARATVAALILAAAIAAGCGDDGGSEAETTVSAATVTVTEPADTTATDETTVGQSTEEDSGSTNEDGAPPAADVEVSSLTGFTSPTGNIGCYIDPSSVRCDISDRDWEPPSKPSSCPGDFGQGITMKAGGAPGFVCANDSALNSGDPLAYGQSIAAGLLRCESAETGMTCTDTETGRGFTLAKEAYSLN